MAAVLGTGAAQKDLVPALMRCYAAADHVVGLDVDKVGFWRTTMCGPVCMEADPACLYAEQLSQSSLLCCIQC